MRCQGVDRKVMMFGMFHRFQLVGKIFYAPLLVLSVIWTTFKCNGGSESTELDRYGCHLRKIDEGPFERHFETV